MRYLWVFEGNILSAEDDDSPIESHSTFGCLMAIFGAAGGWVFDRGCRKDGLTKSLRRNRKVQNGNTGQEMAKVEAKNRAI
jgi:hypothetical protein